MSDAVSVDGEFWVADRPDVRIRGEFSAEAGKKPEARLDARLVDDPRVRPIEGGVASTGSAADSVQAFLPITLQGQLETGESVTLLNAQNHGGALGTPRYVAAGAVLGAHVTGEDQLYTAVRFRLDHPYWLNHLVEGEPGVLEDDGSTLGVETSDDGNWLMYSSSTPATLRQLEIRVVSGCLVLAQLAIGLEQELVTRQTEVRVASGEPCLTVHGPGVSASPGGVHPEMLLLGEVLTVERFAKWIPLNDKLDGLAWAVARTTKDVLEVRVLVATSLVEGLHRRLPYQQSKFPDVAKPVTGRILNAGRNAAGHQADAEGLVRKKVTDAIVFFTEVSFRARATDIVTEVCAAVPEIAESVADLPGRLSNARNEMAHQRRQMRRRIHWKFDTSGGK